MKRNHVSRIHGIHIRKCNNAKLKRNHLAGIQRFDMQKCSKPIITCIITRSDESQDTKLKENHVPEIQKLCSKINKAVYKLKETKSQESKALISRIAANSFNVGKEQDPKNP